MFRKFSFTSRFWWGIALVAISVVIGRLTQFTFFFYFTDPFIRYFSLTIYLLSWIPFILGIWWVGKDYADAVQYYFSHKFYYDSLKKGAKHAAHHGKRIKKHLDHKTKETVAKGKKLTKHVKKKLKKRK